MSSGTRRPHVIIGAGLAGAKAAQTLREEGFDGGIVLIGQESERPYERPPLSKGYLLGGQERDSIYVHPQSWYAEHDVDLRLGVRVETLDPAAHEIGLSDGSRITYDKALLTTGASPRPLPVPGADLDGVRYLRRVEDSDRLKSDFGPTAKVVVIGAGWIGLEAASAARAAGAQVTVLETAGLPLLRVLGREVALIFADLHRDHEVDLRLGVEVTEITGTSGRADGVRLSDGSRVEADVVVVGIGVTPETGLAQSAGLTVNNGVVTDEHLRTSAPDVYAAGDVANAMHPLFGKHIRVEHWANALNQPQTAAKAMLGQDAVHDLVPYFFTDQYDLGMEYAGYVEPEGYDQVVFRGDVGKREFIAFWLSGGRVLAGMNVNIWDVTDAVQDLVRAGKAVDPARLADPDVPLASLLTD